MRILKGLMIMLLLALTCTLIACGEKAVNRDKAFEKVKEFIAEEYQISEIEFVTYKEVYYVEITANGKETKEELIGDVCFRIRIIWCGIASYQSFYYDVSEDKVDWTRPSAFYEELVHYVEDGTLKGVTGLMKGVEGKIKK